MSNLKINDKKRLLVQLIELYIYCGYDISDLVGRPFAYFNYDAVINAIQGLTNEKNSIDND